MSTGNTRDDFRDNPPRRRETGAQHDATEREHDAAMARNRDAVAGEREAVVAREKEQYGGIKIGSAFFGWLTATGTAVLLTALLAGIGTALGLATGAEVEDPSPEATGTVGIVGAILLLIVLFVAYYCGGYVAGRMARFNGVRQGIAVWVWALVIAIVVALLGLFAGTQLDVLANVNAFPRLPINEGALTTAGVITAIAAALVSLGGAVLGGLAGMRFHRKVDRAGFNV